MRRRDFLRTSAAAGIASWTTSRFAGLTVQAQDPVHESSISQEPVFPADGYQAPDWLRYSRGVLFDGYSPPVYPHMKDFDARRLVQTVVDLGGDFLRSQPIGYWAYYPSKVFPLHEELSGRDLINEVSAACRSAGIHHYCYTGYGVYLMLTPDYIKEHPKYADWVLRNPEGEPYGTARHYGWPTVLQRLCTTGDVYRAAIRQVVRELCEHDIEGVYFDAPSQFSYSGICFCDSCRGNFKKFSGLDLNRLAGLARLNGLPNSWEGNLPHDVDMQVLIAWYAWADQLTQEDLLDFRKIVHDSGKFMLCHNGASWRGTSLPLQYRIPDGFMVEASHETYDRLMTGMMGASMARPSKKLAQMYMGGYGVAWLGEPPFEQPGVVHNTNLEDGDEILMEGFTELACGNMPFYGTANRLYFKIGSGSAEPAREVFAFMKQVERIHKDSMPKPYISIVPTWESQQLWREKATSWNWPMMSGGLGLVLLDLGISFDVNPSTEMSEQWLQRQQVIALCGASGISQQDAKRLAVWVESGGSLLATYDSGLYDDRGRMREDGGALREVLGVEMKGGPLSSQPDSYYRVTANHAALGDYAINAVVEGDGRLVPVKAIGHAEVVAECWNLGSGEVRGPAVVVNKYGRGRTVYVSGSLEGNYLYDRVRSTGQLLRSIVEYLGNGTPQPFWLKAPRGVYGILRESPNADLVLWLLADIGFKDADSGRMRQEFVPVTNARVGIRIPDGRQVKSIWMMRANQSVAYEVKFGYATLIIPSLHIAEVLHVELK